jgi:hypothetical protein
MPAHKTLEEYQRARDTATYPHWYFHHCCECNWFCWEYRYGKESPRKNFCVKWDKKVNPDQWARPCFVFPLAKGKRPILLGCARVEGNETRTFEWKKGVCKWHGRVFYYKQYHPNDIRRYCSDYCRWQFKHFLRKIKKNSQLLRPNRQVVNAEKEPISQHSDYRFSLSWGTNFATGPKSNMEIIIPVLIAYFDSERRVTTCYSIFVIDSFCRYLHGGFVVSNDQ